MTTLRRALTWLLACSLSYAGLMQGAQAAMIGTDEAAASAAAAPGNAQAMAGSAQARLIALLQRDDVMAALRERGVSPDEARARVAALSDREAALLAEQVDAVPAGGTDFLGAAVFIFVLLLITDILGFTKIFPFTRSVR
ncbi:MAG: PA2779 family protein [Ideonella sp.]|nr:PA2779 family protein [Ideonella sp.]MCC7459121.1 PA2779 family protein [Nitrospira sp.]